MNKIYVKIEEAKNHGFKAIEKKVLAQFKKLPSDLHTACSLAASSDFIKQYIPAAILEMYCNQ